MQDVSQTILQYVHLAQQFHIRCEGHENQEIAALGNYEHNLKILFSNIIGRRQNQWAFGSVTNGHRDIRS